MYCWGLKMNSFFLNELSLDGQYDTIDDFVKSNKEIMECVRWINKRGYRIYKKSDFYDSHITPDKTIQIGLRGYRSTSGEINDLLRKYKLLLELTSADPYWDMEIEVSGAECYIGGDDVSKTSVEAAACDGGALLSFAEYMYNDRCIDVSYKGNTIIVFSISSYHMLSSYLNINEFWDIDEFFKLRYKGTKLDFSKLESKYGLSEFQKEEIDDCISTFDRFIKMDWEQIYNDQSFYYKEYSPSSKKKNWFKQSKYDKMQIDKFRCVNPKRCFGYREGEKFFVLRMERNHSISDFG